MKFEDYTESVSLVITSCGRLGLLERTLQSFGENNTYPLSQVILVEDSGLNIDENWIAELLQVSSEIVTVIINPRNLGQIAAIDEAYSIVNSDFIFHCEDDWMFFNPYFIERSLDILNSDPVVFCVWLRELNDMNGHPYHTEILRASDIGTEYSYVLSDYRKVWSGFTFNPSLRRTKDAKLLHPYSKVAKSTGGLGKRERITESDISYAYGKLGFKGAIIRSKDGYIRHLGSDQHIASEWESGLVVSLKNLVRRFVKKFNY